MEVLWVLQCCKDAPSSDGAPLPSLHETVPLRSAHFLLFPFPSLWIPNVIQRQLGLTETQFRLSRCPRPQAADPSCGGFSDRVPSASFSWFASSGSSPASHVRLITAFHFDTGITLVACVWRKRCEIPYLICLQATLGQFKFFIIIDGM